jgi:LacI family transcriptional regulator
VVPFPFVLTYPRVYTLIGPVNTGFLATAGASGFDLFAVATLDFGRIRYNPLTSMNEKPLKFAGIKEIARALDVSIGTVDRALHARPGVSRITRDRVLKMAQKLNYRPNVAARSLKLNHRLRVGVFLPEQIALFYDLVREGIRAACSTQSGIGVDLVFHSFPRLGEGESNAIEQADWQQFDGIIIAPGNSAELWPIFRKLEGQHKPVIFVTTDAARLPHLASITTDETASGGIAADLLGRMIFAPAKVATITGDLRIQGHAEKLRGFAASLATLSPHLSLLPAIEAHESPTDAHNAAVDLFKTHPDLGALYISTANSLPVLQAMEERGYLGKVLVITTDLFPDLVPFIEKGNVLASLYQRPFAQGKTAFEMLIRFLTTHVPPKQITRLAPHIVLRSNLSLFINLIYNDDSNPLSI